MLVARIDTLDYIFLNNYKDSNNIKDIVFNSNIGRKAYFIVFDKIPSRKELKKLTKALNNIKFNNNYRTRGFTPNDIVRSLNYAKERMKNISPYGNNFKFMYDNKEILNYGIYVYENEARSHYLSDSFTIDLFNQLDPIRNKGSNDISSQFQLVLFSEIDFKEKNK